MAKVVSLNIKTTDTSDKKQVINVAYVNPAVEDSILKEFAIKLVDLTTENYQEVTKITKESVI